MSNNEEIEIINKKSKYQQPLLKWVGGKTQIINKILDIFPKEMNNYHEFFLGGGSVLLAVLSLQKEDKIKINGQIYAYDLNENLINL
jgi:DNA adenine methylase